MSRSTATPVGRASFPNLSKPDQYNKYSMLILFPKSDPKVTEFARWLRDAVTQEAKGVAGETGLAQAMADFTNFKDGDNVGVFKTYRNEYAGHYVLNMGRKSEYGKVCIVNRDKQPIDASEVYAGCNVIAYIDIFGYKFGAKKSVSVGFQHVMKTGENTPFASTGVKVDDAFAGLDIPDEGEIQQENMAKTAEKPVGPVGSKPAVDPFAGV